MDRVRFLDKNGTFELEDADLCNNLYFPLAGEYGLKSCVTPVLSGDSKVDQNHFLLEPMSIENLNNNRLTRNFWCLVDGEPWSANGNSAVQNATRLGQDKEYCKVTAGFMWHKVERESDKLHVKSEITSFVPYDKNVEVHVVKIVNTSEKDKTFTFIPSIPIYGRSADNIRDHRHVTSLLGRAVVTEKGVMDKPTLSFDERGHNLVDSIYFVESYGWSEASGRGAAEYPEKICPVLDDFIGQGTPDWPEYVVKGQSSEIQDIAGQEIIGAMRYQETVFKPGEEKTYVVYAGIGRDEEEYEKLTAEIDSLEKVQDSLEKTRNYWISKVNIKVSTGDETFDGVMRWVAFQPELRRIFGCSFLPHHDYGKGGRGWRDLWQDCLALLLMDPSGVRQMLLGNYQGVRIDGTNATIIGSNPGEFKADRNSITRVWMDHGVWPFITTKLYIDQTGDIDLLNQECGYFCDAQVFRGKKINKKFSYEDNLLRNKNGDKYEGTILEHILVQNLAAFWEVGEHNIIQLRDADWNDALDMAASRGESVAFTNAYAGNLINLADMLESGRLSGDKVYVFEELLDLLVDDRELYEDISGKKKVLEGFMSKACGEISGNTVGVDLASLAKNLRNKGQWIIDHIRKTQWIDAGSGSGWYNSYYDDNGRALKNMMLTGQVFSIMAGTATDDEITRITESADKLLFDKNSGGYRLNTDFGEVKTDMGRMFGFAYGEKENGAVFSHMAVMYANALYSRGYAKEGYKSLKTLYEASCNYDVSMIYPGIPEYFGRHGKGLYSYLTGAASWYLMTVTMNMFGVHGECGNLVIEPGLLKEQFDGDGKCQIELEYAFRPLKIEISDPENLEYGQYHIKECMVAGKNMDLEGDATEVVISKNIIEALDMGVRNSIEIVLG
ncbi:MAG: cellobiose phosphorylase [Butyrivibrio sp.]|jgi:cellobiose phosphorylase|nr:cellobiose phosphorylase [Butyrivibrio sp.]